jgi:hypothetical protein
MQLMLKFKNMKIFKILSNPYTLILFYSFIMISGEHWGGFYATYVLMALPGGYIHSLLAVSGIISIVAGYHWISKQKNKGASQMINVLGVLLLLASLVYFFKKDVRHYNWGTFEQGYPLFTLCLAAFIAVFFLLGTFWQPVGRKKVHPLNII